MSDPKEYYKILQIEKNCNNKDIKKSYRKLALQYHPDKNPNNKEAEEIFKKISEAYTVLSDNDKRKEYDNISVQHPFIFNTQQNFNPINIFKHFQNKYHMNVHSRGQFSTNFYCSTQTIFKDGKKIVTTVTTQNGQTTKKVLVFDSKTNKIIN